MVFKRDHLIHSIGTVLYLKHCTFGFLHTVFSGQIFLAVFPQPRGVVAIRNSGKMCEFSRTTCVFFCGTAILAARRRPCDSGRINGHYGHFREDFFVCFRQMQLYEWLALLSLYYKQEKNSSWRFTVPVMRQFEQRMAAKTRWYKFFHLSYVREEIHLIL